MWSLFNFFLRYDDTDPTNKRPDVRGYFEYLFACNWLGLKIEGIIFASKRLNYYVEQLKKGLNQGWLYVSLGNTPSNGYDNSVALNRMYFNLVSEPKQAVIRYKGDDKWVCARLVSGLKHPLGNDSVEWWPTLSFQSPYINTHSTDSTLSSQASRARGFQPARPAGLEDCNVSIGPQSVY